MLLPSKMGLQLDQNSMCRHKHLDLELRGGQEPPGKASEAPESLPEPSQDATGSVPDALQTGPKRHRTKLSEFFWGNAAHEDEVVMHVCSWQTVPARGSDSLAVAVSPYSWQYIPAHASVFLHVAILATMLWAVHAMVPMHVWPWTRATASSAKIILVGTVADHRASGLGYVFLVCGKAAIRLRKGHVKFCKEATESKLNHAES